MKLIWEGSPTFFFNHPSRLPRTKLRRDGFIVPDITSPGLFIETGALMVSGVFSDYDGTLAHLGSSRFSQEVASRALAEMRELSKVVPIGIITMKDAGFIVPRTDFASAWACVGGLEVMFRDGSGTKVPGLLDMVNPFLAAREKFGKRAFIEPKRARDGGLLGFCIDWRGDEKPPGLEDFLSDLRSKEFFVHWDSEDPFADILGGAPNKGIALRFLKKTLALRGPVIYLGDSVPDNSAFREADASVAVVSGRVRRGLHPDFTLEPAKLPSFLRALRERKLILEKGDRFLRRIK